MDDRKIFEMTRLKLAYQKQLYLLIGAILLALIGLVLYIINIYKYNFSLFIVAVVILITGIICIMTVDQKMKIISVKIKGLG
jgi:hypothetical protein